MATYDSQHPRKSARTTRPMRWYAATVCALLLFLVLTLFRSQITPRRAEGAQAAWLLTGDEPTYLLMAQAVARGDGLNVRPALHAKEFKAFQDRPPIKHSSGTWHRFRRVGFKPLVCPRARWHRAQRPQLSPLFPWVLSSFIRHTEHVRWSAALFQAVLVSTLAFLLVGLSPSGGNRSAWHIGAAALFSLGTLPVGYYTAQVYPEILTGVLLITSLLLYCNARSLPRLLGQALMMASLFGTSRAVVAVAAASVVTVCTAIARKRWLELAVPIIGWVAYITFNIWVWGAPLSPSGMSFLHHLGPDTSHRIQLYLTGSVAATILGAFLLLAWPRKRIRMTVLCAALLAATWIMPILEWPVLILCGMLAVAEWHRGHKATAGFLAGGVAVKLALNWLATGILLTPPDIAIALTARSFLPEGLLRVFYANDIGLFFLSPFTFLGVAAGIWLVTQRRRTEDWMWLALFWGSVFVVASFHDFRAGRCAAGRYEVIPGLLLLYPIWAVLTDQTCPWRKRLIWALYIFGIPSLLMAIKVGCQPNYWFRDYHPLFAYAKIQPFYGLLPDPQAKTFLLTILIWTALFLLALFARDGWAWLSAHVKREARRSVHGVD